MTALAFFVIATPADVFEAMGGFRSACLFVANWYFIHQSTDYFAANVNSNPVLHFWSLAVEEQFYLVWPLVLGGLFALSRRAGRGRWWVLRIAVAVLALASAIEALHIGSTNLDRAYYGTDTRVYQLLAGAFLALTPQLLRLAPAARRVIRALAMPSLLALVVLRDVDVLDEPDHEGPLRGGLRVGVDRRARERECRAPRNDSCRLAR